MTRAQRIQRELNYAVKSGNKRAIERQLEQALSFWMQPKAPASKKTFMPGPNGVGYSVSAMWTGEVYDYPALETAYKIDPWIYRGVKVVADSLAAVPLKVYREIEVGGEVKREEVFDHPLVDRLWNPADRISGTGFIRETAAAFALDGEFFWFIDNGSGGQRVGGDVVMLRRLASRHIDRVRIDRNGRVVGYEYLQDGQSATILPEFIVHGKSYNPLDDTRGLPALEVAKQPILLSYYMHRYNTAFFANDATPAGILTAKGPLGDEARKVNLLNWYKTFKGPDNKGKIAHLDSETTFQVVGSNAKDGEYLGLEKMSREEKLAIVGVPPSIVGVMEFANYSNMKEQTKIFYQFTVQPLAVEMQDAINSQLIPVWYPEDADELYVEFDFSGVEALQEDRLQRAQIHQIYVNSGIMTPDEVRLQLQLEPKGGTADDLKQPTPSGFGLLSDGRPVYAKASLAPTRDDQWWAFDSKLARRERPFVEAMRDYFRGQWQRLNDGMAKLFVSELSAGRLFANVTKDNFDAIMQALDWAEEDTILRKIAKDLYKAVAEEAGQQALDSVKEGLQFNVSDPIMQDFLASKEFRIVNVNNTTRERLRKILIDGVADNQTVQEIKRTIQDVYEDFSANRALTIARTEVLSANNGAAIQGYKQSGVVNKKEWMSAKDSLVRDSHAEIDGQVVDIDAPFGNGLQAPGVDGPPEEVINCRCSILPVLDD